MSKEINGNQLEIIFKHIEYLLVCGSLMAGGAAVAKYASKISTSFPQASMVSGVIMALAGLGLTGFVATYGMQELSKYYNSKFKALIYGLFYLYMSCQLAMALFFAATNP